MTVDLAPLEPLLAAEGYKGNLIAVLQKTQALYGYLPPEAIRRVAEYMAIAPAKVLGVATFYTQFRMAPMGRYLIQLCRGTACHVNGAPGIADAISEFLGIGDGETTPDGLFTLQNVACLGCCSLSPVMMVNGEPYGNLTPDSAKQALSDIKESMGDSAL